MTDKNKYSVYVVELNPEVVKSRKFLDENQNINTSLPCYYVGMTGITPEKRFDNHKKGYKHSRIVKKFGVRLVPKLYKNLNPMTYEEAQKMEIYLAKKLKARGHGVWQK